MPYPTSDDSGLRAAQQQRREQRELDEIYRNSQDLAKVPENYWQWRDEYFRAGKFHAFGRMMELYDPEKHDDKIPADSPAVRYPEPRSPVKWFLDLPAPLAILVIFAGLGMYGMVIGIVCLVPF
jgi:hypothetical protein